MALQILISEAFIISRFSGIAEKKKLTFFSSRFHFLKMPLIRVALLLYLMLSLAKGQPHGCYLEGFIGLEECFEQDEGSLGTCCNAITAVIQAGFQCFCSLFISSGPFVGIGTRFSLLVSSCYTAVPPPPVALCRVLVPTPVVLPSNISRDYELSSAMRRGNSTIATEDPDSTANGVVSIDEFREPNETSEREETLKLMYNVLFLFLLLIAQ